MRIQWQQQRGGRTIHHGSLVLEAVGGVTTDQLISAMHALRRNESLPRSEQSGADSALMKALRWIDTRPPEGVNGRFSKSFYFDPLNLRESWRFDIEGLSGYNLQQ
jgi:hypothetical protein